MSSPLPASRNRTYCDRRLLSAVTMIPLVVWGLTAARAADAPGVKIIRTVAVDELGNAQVKLDVRLPSETYSQAKAAKTNMTVLLRRLGVGQHWAKLENIHGHYDDNNSTAVIEYTQLNCARIIEGDLWEIVFDADVKLDVMGTFGNAMLVSTSTPTDFGAAIMNVRIDAPKTATDMQLKHSPERITYQLTAATAPGTRSAATFTMDVKPQIMSCLAKSYGDSRLTDLWVARGVLKNSGDQAISDYRVRFRLSGYSSWSQWRRTRRVLPGQTVVDPYFPVFDMDRMTQLSGARAAMLEVEYEYRQQDGRTIHESDSRQLQLLGRNQVFFTGLSDAVSFYDKFSYAPIVMASFVTADDPVMQELAGRISQMAGGPAASANDEDALKFLKAVYQFLSNSKIAYQTPSSPTFGGQIGQSVKFGRDVLRNRAGTCVDLAILYASLCESVGLQPILCLTNGHCLPAVRMPSGQITPLELTLIGKESFTTAVGEGAKKIKEARADGRIFEIDIAAWHNQGVHSLDLPASEPGLVSGFFGAVVVKNNPDLPPGLAGTWTMQQATGTGTALYTLICNADGTYTYTATVTSNGQSSVADQEAGTFRWETNTLKFNPTNAKSQPSAYTFSLNGNELKLQLQGTGNTVTFRRAG